FTRPLPFLVIGLFSAIMIIAHFTAITMTDVAYMISVKRTSLVFSVVYGWLMFSEEKIGERLLGSVIMMIGVVLIALF
ncbi:MAG: EamA family transporter, partial [Deltaproteobacteria bacterium]|nr:EamA family transporter [Deltaproteobacteria bacterium]